MNRIPLISQNDVIYNKSSSTAASKNINCVSFQGKRLLNLKEKKVPALLLTALSGLYLYSKNFFKIGEDYRFDPRAKNNVIPAIPDYVPSARFKVMKEDLPPRTFGVILAPKELVLEKIEEAKKTNKEHVTIVLETKLSESGSPYNFDSYKKQIIDLNENLLQDISYKNGTKVVKTYDPTSRKLLSKIVNNNKKYQFEYIYNDDGTVNIKKTKISGYRDSIPSKYSKSIKLVDSNGTILSKINKDFESYSEALEWQGEGIDRSIRTYQYNPETDEVTIGKEIFSPGNVDIISKYKKMLNKDVIEKAMKTNIVKATKSEEVDDSGDYAEVVTIQNYYDENGKLICVSTPKYTRYYIKDETKDSWFDLDSERGILLHLHTDLYEDCEKIGTLKYSYRNGLISDVPEGYFEDFYRIKKDDLRM